MIYVISVSLSGGDRFSLKFHSQEKAEKTQRKLENVLIGTEGVNDTAVKFTDDEGDSVAFRPQDLVAVGFRNPKEAVNVDVPTVNPNEFNVRVAGGGFVKAVKLGEGGEFLR